jgi:deazaflavin-dependent oxidoreductase (nitroreductase family)
MPTPPPPWLKRLYRAPQALYRVGLGRLLGHRFLLLTHTGRRSGARHQAFVEVVRYDPATGEAVVIAGYGKGSDWYRNVRAGGPAWVDFGRGPRRAVFRDVAPDEAADVLVGYERRYGLLRPLLRHVISALAGFDYRGTAHDRRRAVEILPMLALAPRR